MNAPRTYIRRRRMYATIEIDLWPCPYDLNDAGMNAVFDYVRWLQGAGFGKDAIVAVNPEFITATRIPITAVNGALVYLLDLVSQPEHQVQRTPRAA